MRRAPAQPRLGVLFVCIALVSSLLAQPAAALLPFAGGAGSGCAVSECCPLCAPDEPCRCGCSLDAPAGPGSPGQPRAPAPADAAARALLGLAFAPMLGLLPIDDDAPSFSAARARTDRSARTALSVPSRLARLCVWTT